MSGEGQQDTYHDEQSSVDQQLAAQPDVAQSTQQSSHKRKRDSLEDNGEAEEGRAGTEGSTSSRRTSFKQTSPMSAFMPINPNSPQNAQYAYQPLNVAQQHSPNAMNGSSAVLDAATHAAIAANAMHLGLPSLSGAGSNMPYDAGKPVDPPPVEGHTEGVGGVAHPPPPRQTVQHSTPTPNPKPQVGTEEWHRVRRDNHKEGGNAI